MLKNTVRFIAYTILASTLVLTQGFLGGSPLFSNDGVAVALTIAEKAAAKAAKKAAKKAAANAAKAGKRSAITAKKAAMKAEMAAKRDPQNIEMLAEEDAIYIQNEITTGKVPGGLQVQKRGTVKEVSSLAKPNSFHHGGGGGSGKVNHVVPVEEKGVQGDRLKDEDELSKIDDRKTVIDRDRIKHDRKTVIDRDRIKHDRKTVIDRDRNKHDRKRVTGGMEKAM